MGRVQAARVPGPLRCPLCHDDVAPSESACGSCGAIHHAECAKGGTCASCASPFARQPVADESPRWVGVADRAGVVLGGAAGLLAFAVLATRPRLPFPLSAFAGTGHDNGAFLWMPVVLWGSIALAVIVGARAARWVGRA